MRPKSIILLTLALGCGLVASIGINQVMANRRTEPRGGETVPIFVALTDISLGDPVTPQNIKLEDWPKDKVPKGSLTDLKMTEGRRARTRIFAGDPLREEKLLGAGESSQSAADLIPNGMRVVAVKVDAQSGSAGLVQVGDRVDVLVHLQQNQNRNISQTTTKTFLQNVKVFAVNQQFSRPEDGKEGAVTAATISLLVTPHQAEAVTLASALGDIRLVMRSATDEGNEETPGLTPDELLRVAGSAPPKPAATGKGELGSDLMKMLTKAAPAPAPQPVVEPQPTVEPLQLPKVDAFTMIVMKGFDRQEANFQNDKLTTPTSSLFNSQAPKSVEPTPAIAPSSDKKEGDVAPKDHT